MQETCQTSLFPEMQEVHQIRGTTFACGCAYTEDNDVVFQALGCSVHLLAAAGLLERALSASCAQLDFFVE